MVRTLRPFRQQLVNDTQHAVRIGAVGVVRYRQAGYRPCQIQPVSSISRCAAAASTSTAVNGVVRDLCTL
jgi:hypothetical protein